MVRHGDISKEALKKVEMFRTKQRKVSPHANEQMRKSQYRELEEILSPFWAWRARSS